MGFVHMFAKTRKPGHTLAGAVAATGPAAVRNSMAEFDNDLQSIQEARRLAEAARDAQRQFSHASQAEVDRVCAAMAEAAFGAAERLGRLASEETGYGVPEHKTLKNVLASKILWDAIRDIPTVGVIGHDEKRKLYEIAWPMGVVAALTP